MKIEIKSWISGSVLFEGDFSCLADAVKAAVSAKANLSSANLSYANLSSADLRSADLSSANLSYANLSSADLSSADLSYANLSSANLSSADLSSANLSSANLSYANLSSADLSYANLSYANLSSADLRSADLSSANLSSAKNISAQTAAELLMCPQEGDFIGWKKCLDGVIAKLLIPADAKRSSSTSRKCRAEYVKTLALFKDGKAFAGPAMTTTEGNKTVYAIGEITRPDKWDDDRWNECSNGIHFFITETEAKNY